MALRAMRGSLFALGLVAALALGPRAYADETRRVGVSLNATGGLLDPRGTGVSASDEPSPLKGRHPSLLGTAERRGAGVQAFLVFGPLRLGLGDGLYAVGDGLEVHHDPLDGGFSARTASSWGGYGELFAGYQARLGPFYPYADVRLSADLLFVNVDLLSPQFGKLGSTQYSSVRGDLGLRLGAIVPMGNRAFLDVSGQGGLLGPERLSLTMGVGCWFGSPLPE